MHGLRVQRCSKQGAVDRVAWKSPSSPLPKINLNALPAEEVKAISLVGHAALGRWFYGEHSREITEDGFCVLRQGDEVI